MREHAALVDCAGPGVDFVGTEPQLLLDAILDQPALTLNPQTCRHIVRLVERDHKHHTNYRG